MDLTSVLSSFKDILPLTSGLGLLIWLFWRLFWKMDRRSQMELAAKDKEIVNITAERDKERILRFAADERSNESKERASRADSREAAREARLQDLTDQIVELRAEIVRLRTQLNNQQGLGDKL